MKLFNIFSFPFKKAAKQKQNIIETMCNSEHNQNNQISPNSRTSTETTTPVKQQHEQNHVNNVDVHILLRKFSPLRRILPMALCFLVFGVVMAVLVIYVNVTAQRHHQFRVNMSQDYEMLGVSQDNEQLVTYIREVQLTPAIEPHHKPIESENKGPTEDTLYVIKLLNEKKNGIFIEAGAYNDGKFSRTEYLERKLNWRGLLIQPDPRHYFSLRRHNRIKSQAIHACLSPAPYPKEVTYHPGNEVKINTAPTNSLIEDSDWFNTRVKCFPLFSLLLAINVTNIDYLSLESGGTELQVLETIPFDRVNIEVIGVHLMTNTQERDTIKIFLATKKYKLMQEFNTTMIFMLNRVKI